MDKLSKQDWVYLRSLLIENIRDVEEWASVGGEQSISASNKAKKLNTLKSKLDRVIETC